jgi:hypothetical protein
MSTVFEALGDPTIRSWYLAFCFGLMVLPMAGLAWWYHANIRKTEGGRRLVQRHAQSPPWPHDPEQAQHNLGEAAAMARDVASGKYGETARTIQNRTYWIVGLWLLANALAFGLLFWADEANQEDSRSDRWAPPQKNAHASR